MRVKGQSELCLVQPLLCMFKDALCDSECPADCPLRSSPGFAIRRDSVLTERAAVLSEGC